MHHTLIPAARAAEALGISHRTLRSWAQQGKFPRPIHIGRKAYYQQGQVDTFIQASIDGAKHA